MITKAFVNLDVDLKSLAESLLKRPDDFGQLWFHFAELQKKGGVDLEEHGKVMADVFGGVRRDPFIAILNYMRYFEQREADGKPDA